MQRVGNRWSRVFAVCVLLGAAGWIPLKAQAAGTAALAGTVIDQTGKAVQNATVVMKHESTGFSKTAATDGDGRFSATDLPAGVYSIEASAPGFAKSTRAGVHVDPGRT